jgi:hypothetical protein
MYATCVSFIFNSLPMIRRLSQSLSRKNCKAIAILSGIRILVGA